MLDSTGVHAYVLMPNHAHLVVETPEGNLSGGMQWLKTSYAMWFNRREGRVGPLFEGRYKAVLFEGRGEAWPISRYVHLNPVRVAGLLYGSRDWIERMRRLLRGDRREQRALRQMAGRPNWEGIRKAVEEVKGERWAAFSERYGDSGRDLALYVGRRYGGMNLAGFGKAAGIANYYTVAQALRRFEERCRRDRRVHAALTQMLKCTNVKT